MIYVLLLAAIAAGVVATSSLPRTRGFTLLVPSVVAVAGYTLAAFLLALVVRSMPVGVAYAIWTGVGTLTVLVGATFLGHPGVHPAAGREPAHRGGGRPGEPGRPGTLRW